MSFWVRGNEFLGFGNEFHDFGNEFPHFGRNEFRPKRTKKAWLANIGKSKKLAKLKHDPLFWFGLQGPPNSSFDLECREMS